MQSRHRQITTARSVTAFGNYAVIALAFVVLMVCSPDAQQQPVNAASPSVDSAVASATDADDKTPAPAAQTRAGVSSIGLTPYVALVIGSSLDFAGSMHALAHTPGARESNPLLAFGGTHGFVAGKVATTVGLVWAMHRIAKGGHPTLAKVIGWTGGIGLSGVAWHNVTTR